jgi:hypothetical protein
MDGAMRILTIRAETLRANLENVKVQISSLPDPRTALKSLQNGLISSWKSLSDLQKKVWIAKIDVGNLGSGSNPANIAQELEATEKTMAAVVDELKRAEAEIRSMQAKCYRINEHEIGAAITSYLEQRTQPALEALAEIQADLQKPAGDFQQQWQSFLSTPRALGQEIFTEYIDFLGGFALRDAGFDEGISRLADELLQSYTTKSNLHMMAIPTRQQAVAMSLAGIVRVTFPDWTIWSLPSTAHQFWHVVASKDLESKLRLELRQLSGNKNDNVELRFSDCLADAFATYTMGPAYAFFAICLLLNPASPFTASKARVEDRPVRETERAQIEAKSTESITVENPADDVRAHSVFEMLKCMDSKESAIDPPYAKVRNDLNAAWMAAIAETGTQPIIDKKKQINEAEQVAADKKRVAVLVEALWKTLITSPFPPFTREVWDEILRPKTASGDGGWVHKILKHQVEQIQIPHGAELRHVLNAVWLARIDPERKIDPEGKSGLDITRVANELRQRVANPEGSNQ